MDATRGRRRHPRVRFVFTPKHGSWLDQIEIWFGILTRSALRHRSFEDVAALTCAIYKLTRHWNAVSLPRSSGPTRGRCSPRSIQPHDCDF